METTIYFTPILQNIGRLDALPRLVGWCAYGVVVQMLPRLDISRL